MNSLFPKQDWTDFVLSEIEANKLDNFNPADAPDFYLDGTSACWVHLLSAMAKHESDFDPKLTYNESGDLEGIVSTGLFQISEESARSYAKYARNNAIKAEVAAATTAKLKDPFFNIRVAVIILKRWAAADGVVATSSKPWLGGSRYWSVLRKGAPKVKKTLKAIYENLTLPELKSTGSQMGAHPTYDVSTSRRRGKGRPSPAAPTPAAATNPSVPREVALAYQARQNLGSRCNWIFEVDYAINSSKPRLFIYSISDRKLYKYKCAHGKGGANERPHDGNIREVSNVNGSGCSSLGVIRTGAPYTSGLVGKALRLHGLSPTNSNILSRGVVLHGSEYVFDNDSSSNTTISGRSQGCIAVDDRYIDFEEGGEMIGWLSDGSIGVAHYGGRFEIV